jgi:hypothetical protein
VNTTQITELKAWAARLEERPQGDELKAAGKAIAMLVGEVENLQARLSTPAAVAPPPLAPKPVAPAETVDPMWTAADDRVQGSLRSRLKRSLGFE